MKKTPKLLLLFLGILLFLIFVLFSYLVQKGIFNSFDFDTTVRIQDRIPRFFDTPFSFLSLVGSFEISILILLVILAIFRKLRGIFVLILFTAIHLPELFGKVFVNHPGPPYLFFRYDIPFLFPSSYVQPGSSYPSGHLARTLFITVIFAFLIYQLKKLPKLQRQIIYCLIVVFVVLMFISRIYLGEHWLSDVIGGSLLGLSIGLFSALFLF